MEINNLKKKQIVTKDGHFSQKVFIEAVALAGGGALIGKFSDEVVIKLNQNKFSESQLMYVNRTLFRPISIETMDRNELIMSTNDITF